jgi:hypothetical protein
MHEDDVSEIIGLLQENRNYLKEIAVGIFVTSTALIIALVHFW